jgi:hypothetical protein
MFYQEYDDSNSIRISLLIFYPGYLFHLTVTTIIFVLNYGQHGKINLSLLQ